MDAREVVVRSAALLALALGLWAGPGAADDASFCESVVETLSTCVSVPTVDSVDLSKYTGRWYEIGAGAQFTQFSHAVCVTANYSAMGIVNGKNTIKVVNRGLGVVSSFRSTQVLLSSVGAGASGLGVRYLCQFLVGNQPLGVAFPGLKVAAALGPKLTKSATNLGQKVALELVANLAALKPSSMNAPNSVLSFSAAIAAQVAVSNLTSEEKGTIAAELANVQAAVNSSSATASQVFQALEIIQRKSFVLLGGSLPAPYSLGDALKSIKDQAAALQSLATQISTSRQQILASARKIVVKAGSKAPGVSNAGVGLGALAQSLGPLGLTVAAIKGGAAAISAIADTIFAEPLQTSITGITGTATQNATHAGALTVTFFGSPGPYNIIKLDGNAATGYNTALVYSCSSSLATAFTPQSLVFLISRTPTVPQSTIDDALAFLQANKVFLGGDNGYLPNVQDPTLCQPIYSLP